MQSDLINTLISEKKDDISNFGTDYPHQTKNQFKLQRLTKRLSDENTTSNSKEKKIS